MDLYAYFQIDQLSGLAKDNGIEIPRLRGYRLMAEESKLPVKTEAKEAARHQFETFNKYVGRDDVLYIHARIGGGNWLPYGGADIEKQPWFIEKVDDCYDQTYCDIYARIKQEDGL